jgi:SAM-dependent methyltransferase
MQTINDFISKRNQSWFKEWFDTYFYQQLYSNRNEQEAQTFVDNLVNELAPKENSIMLDLGCGAGRHAKCLAAHGYHVTGVDLSPSSIRAAKKVHTEGAQFYQHDMRLPFCVSRYHYIFSFFTSFGYFKTQAENDAVIQNIAMALKPKGTIVLDYLNVNYSEDRIIEKETKEIDGVYYDITRWDDETHFYKQIAVKDSHEGSEIHEYREQVEKIRLHEFDLLFKKHGLKLKQVYGDYNLNSYDPDRSPRLIMIAEKI